MTKLSSRRVYDGKMIHVDLDTVRFPDGSTGDLEMVRHPGASAVVSPLPERKARETRSPWRDCSAPLPTKA